MPIDLLLVVVGAVEVVKPCASLGLGTALSLAFSTGSFLTAPSLADLVSWTMSFLTDTMAFGLLCNVRTEKEELAHGAILDTIQAGGLEESGG